MASGGPPTTEGPYFYQENGKTYFSIPSHMINGIMNCNHYTTYYDASSIHDSSVRTMNPRYGQPQNPRESSGENEGLATRGTTANHSAGNPRLPEAAATANPRTFPTTIDSSVQTDNTANFIVSKDTLIAYTIAVIQQTLDYQFGQMSIVYQSAHNSAMQDTPSWAEQLANEHFNIVLLNDQTLTCRFSNDPNSTPPPTMDPTPITSSQETTPKSVDQGHNESTLHKKVYGPTYVPYSEEGQKILLPQTTDMSRKENLKLLYNSHPEGLCEDENGSLEQSYFDSETFHYMHETSTKHVLVQGVYV